MKKRIYLDTCCFNRPFDCQDDLRIHRETMAIREVINRAHREEWDIIGSDILRLEILSINNYERKMQVLTLYRNLVIMEVPSGKDILESAKSIQHEAGIAAADSLHIASAITGEAKWLLTTDDKMERRASKMSLGTKVMNPIDFLKEASRDDVK